ncbi:MAG: DUF6316 family protein, partial [Gammaproteobacteria bacterium]|nr:DUF6316 family protein [Gammaproteobacteria bacterium]
CVRTQRYFETDEGWFLRTREGIPVGPYQTAFDVEIAASLLSPQLAQADKASEVISTIQAFIRDPVKGPPRALQTIKRTQVNAKAATGMNLPVIGHSLKRGCVDFIEHTIYVAQQAKTRLSKLYSYRSRSARSISPTVRTDSHS